MLNINDINATIRYYEEQGTNLDNCRILADLYTCRNNIKDDTESELDDILPRYNMYCDVKREYQLNNTTKDKVITSMQSVCIEIKEFIQSLYSHTDMQEERDLIKEMINTLYNNE